MSRQLNQYFVTMNQQVEQKRSSSNLIKNSAFAKSSSVNQSLVTFSGSNFVRKQGS
jgi:hypothetical protein